MHFYVTVPALLESFDFQGADLFKGWAALLYSLTFHPLEVEAKRVFEKSLQIHWRVLVLR